jgi:hypothetical protein
LSRDGPECHSRLVYASTSHHQIRGLEVTFPRRSRFFADSYEADA